MLLGPPLLVTFVVAKSAVALVGSFAGALTMFFWALYLRRRGYWMQSLAFGFFGPAIPTWVIGAAMCFFGPIFSTSQPASAPVDRLPQRPAPTRPTASPAANAFASAATGLTNEVSAGIAYSKFDGSLTVVLSRYEAARNAETLHFSCQEAVMAWSVTRLLWSRLLTYPNGFTVAAGSELESYWRSVSGETAVGTLVVDTRLVNRGLVIAGQKWLVCRLTIG